MRLESGGGGRWGWEGEEGGGMNYISLSHIFSKIVNCLQREWYFELSFIEFIYTLSARIRVVDLISFPE